MDFVIRGPEERFDLAQKTAVTAVWEENYTLSRHCAALFLFENSSPVQAVGGMI